MAGGWWPWPLVGRSEELEGLGRAVSTPPAVVVVEGEAGVGKTRLVSELSRAVCASGRRSIWGEARPIHATFPFGPVLEGLRQADAELAPVRLSPVAGALRPLLPELAHVLPPALEPPDDRSAQRHRVFRALTELVGALCPLVLVLEDLHWADDRTVEWLRYVAADPPDGLSLVATFRAEEADVLLRDLVTRLPVGVAGEHVTLAPLAEAQTGRLAAAIAGVPGVSEDFTAALQERTGGLPFAVEQVVALLGQHEAQPEAPDRWGSAVLERVGVPAAVRDHVLARVGLLDPAVREVVELVSVLGDVGVVDERLVAEVGGRPVAEVARCLAPVVRARLLVDEGAGLRFPHVLAAQAVYDEVPGPVRRQWHARAAAALARQHPEPSGRVAYHWRQAGWRDEWVAAAERAADQAHELGHDEEAARLLEDVLRRGSVPAGDAARLAAKLGYAARETPYVPQVRDLLAATLEQDLPSPQRAELALLLAGMLDEYGLQPERVRALACGAVRDAAGHPEIQAFALVGLAQRPAPQTALADWRAQLRRALALTDVADRASAERLYGHLCGLFMLCGDATWREVAARVHGGDRQPRRVWYAYLHVGEAACYVGHYDEAERWLAAVLSTAREHDDRRLVAFARVNTALLDYLRGRWDGLPAELARLSREVTHDLRYRRTVDLVTGLVAAAHGDPERTGLPEDAGAGLHPLAASHLRVLAVAASLRAALRRGETGRAVALAGHHLTADVERPLWPADFRCLPWLVAALVAGGRAAEADALAARHASALEGCDTPFAQPALQQTRAYLALTGAPAAAADSLLAAADGYEAAQCPYEAAQAREDAAQALARAGDADAAARSLTAATGGYERLGARWDVARAAHIARRHGLPGPVAHRRGRKGYGRDLTPRERDVVRLAASGSPNKEIAAELFVTVATVKKHLTSAMDKLGVPSRAALAHRVAHQGDRTGDAPDGDDPVVPFPRQRPA